MKKILFLFALTIVLAGAYAQQSNQQIKVDPRLYEVLGNAKVNDLLANNPRQLVVENCNLASYCFLALKMTETEGTYQMKGDLKNFVKPGKSCDYQQILNVGYINRYDFNLEQDANLENIYTLGSTGAYIVVLSKKRFDKNLNGFLKEYGLE